MTLNQPLGIPFQNPTDYTGPKMDIIPIRRFPRRPLTTDKKYRIGQFAIIGRNPTTGTEGDLWYLARFESNGDATWLEFSNAVAEGAWNLISTQAANNSSDVRFTSGITSLYSTYALILSGIVPVTDDVDLMLEFSSDGGSTWLVTGYAAAAYGHNIDIGDIDAETTTHIPLTLNDQAGSAISNIALRGYSGQVTLTQLTTGATPHAESHATFLPSTILTTFFAEVTSGGVGPAATTVNALRILMASGNISTGEISLYGISD